MDDRRISPYVFRPILEPFEDVSSGNSGTEIRSRVYSGDLWPASQCVSSPITTRGAPASSATSTVTGTTGPLAVNPKLLACFKQDTWSNAGSRHSSRPGSSLASSRPSSQCASLYCRSNNSSLSDVSVARNFQQLTVSNRRSAYKTQKWSHSYEPNGAAGGQASAGSAQSSPGRRRQTSLQQKSLDLDSGYLGSSAGDLKSWASHSQCSWNETSMPQAAYRTDTALSSAAAHSLRSPLEEDVVKHEVGGFEDDLSARCASLPSFHESFQPTSGHHLILDPQSQLSMAADHLFAGDDSLDDLDEEIKMIVARGQDSNPVVPANPANSTQSEIFIPERCGRLTEISKFVRPEPVRSVSLGFSRDGSRNPLLSHSGGHVTVVSESSQESEKSGLPPRPMRRLVRSKRIYEEHLTKEDDGADQGKPGASSGCYDSDSTANLYKMHFEDQMISGYRLPHHYIGSDAATLSPDTIAGSPHLPMSTPVNSPPASAGTTSPHVLSNEQDSRIFQFPPPEHLQKSCREDWMTSSFRDPVTSSTGDLPVSSSSPMAISPADLSTLNTPRSSLASVQSRNSPMNTENTVNVLPAATTQESVVDDLYLPYFDDDINFASGGNVQFSNASYSLTSMNFDHVPLAGFPSPPGSGYSSPVPAYMDSMNNDLQSVVSASPASYDLDTKPDLDCYGAVMSPYTAALRHRTDLYSGAASSTPDPESFLSSDTCPETPDGSLKEEVDSPDTGAYLCLWDSCHEEFETQKLFVEHLNEAHTETKKGCDEFPCLWKDCSRKLKPFNAKYKLITHMRVHTKEKPYRCTFENCNRAFARSENRKIHVRSHTGQKPFSCKFSVEFNCNKKFSNSSDRAKHEQTHKDPKPYKCEVVGCNKRYTDPSSLRKHVKGHTQEEQMQYRRAKDIANQAKRSISPTARFWMMETSGSSERTCLGPDYQQLQQQGHQVTSSGNLLQPGLQSGGTLYTVDESSDFQTTQQQQQQQQQQQKVMKHGRQLRQQQDSNYSSENHFQGLVHQPDSLDDLDNETIPFDNIPVRYESEDLFEMPEGSWTEEEQIGSSSTMQM